VEDLHGQLEMMAKQAMICRLRGDDRAATEKAAQYVHVHDRAVEKMREETGDEAEFRLLAPR
jgi:hypothetical protein